MPVTLKDFIEAAEKSNFEVLKAYISQGSDVNAAMDWKDETLITVPDRMVHGTNALIQASARGNEKVVEFLLDNGANANHTTSQGKWTPLFPAAFNGHLAVAKLLVEKGRVDIGAKDSKGYTAKDAASNMKHHILCNYLFNKEAEIKAGLAGLSSRDKDQFLDPNFTYTREGEGLKDGDTVPLRMTHGGEVLPSDTSASFKPNDDTVKYSSKFSSFKDASTFLEKELQKGGSVTLQRTLSGNFSVDYVRNKNTNSNVPSIQ